ncbi:MAG: type VI secretion system tube protein Hcp [Acidobacteriota bacterium]|nr:MAG: type VI secretion system tube protein Hcp [Acidobacteriota bacterium]
MAESDFYLQIDGVEGECVAPGFEKQMQISSWSFGATNSGSSTLGTGLGSGRASIQDFHFVVENGKASPALFRHTCKGTHIPKAVLTCRKTGGDGNPYTYYKVTFEELALSSFQTGASSTLPMEQTSFNFTKITLEFFQQKQDGSVSLVDTAVYDVKKVEAV